MGKWFWGILILAIVSALLTMIGPWNAKARSAQMGESIESALTKSEYNFAKVGMSGNVATLTGNAPSETVSKAAEKLAASTTCSTCKDGKDKIWHVVKNDMTIAEGSDPETISTIEARPAAAATVPDVSPYTFSAIKIAEGTVDLSGYVESAQDKKRLINEAEAIFGDNLRDRKIRVANGAPSDGWIDVVSLHLPQLYSLDYGSFSLEGHQALLRGQSSDTAVRDSINSLVVGLPGEFKGAANISVPNTTAVNAGEVSSASMCQSLFNDLKGDSRINFASSKAEIRGADSYDLLNTLASAAMQCKSFRIRVEGHTDSQGDDDYNQWLSDQRAARVGAYLIENGVETNRIDTIGFGETQPIATNDTPVGRAANRRIGFVVEQSE